MLQSKIATCRSTHPSSLSAEIPCAMSLALFLRGPHPLWLRHTPAQHLSFQPLHHRGLGLAFFPNRHQFVAPPQSEKWQRKLSNLHTMAGENKKAVPRILTTKRSAWEFRSKESLCTYTLQDRKPLSWFDIRRET